MSGPPQEAFEVRGTLQKSQCHDCSGIDDESPPAAQVAFVQLQLPVTDKQLQVPLGGHGLE